MTEESKRPFVFHDTTESDNNSMSISNSDHFVVLIDKKFMESDKANDELRQAIALKKPISVLVYAEMLELIPEWIKEVKYENVVMIEDKKDEKYAASLLAKLILKQKK